MIEITPELTVYTLDLIGTSIFAVTGALAALEKKMDYFGVIVLAVITAIGGGTIRDVLMDNMPPFYFTQYSYLVVAIVTALAVFAKPGIFRALDKPITYFDAMGLGLFTVIGAQKAVAAGFPFVVVLLLALITGVGGGMLRDVLRNEIPFILQKEIYASAALVGAAVFFLIMKIAPAPVWPAMISGAICTTTVRLLSVKFKLGLPRGDG